MDSTVTVNNNWNDVTLTVPIKTQSPAAIADALSSLVSDHKLHPEAEIRQLQVRYAGPGMELQVEATQSDTDIAELVKRRRGSS